MRDKRPDPEPLSPREVNEILGVPLFGFTEALPKDVLLDFGVLKGWVIGDEDSPYIIEFD